MKATRSMANHKYCTQDSVHPLLTEYFLPLQSCIFLTSYMQASTAIHCMKKYDPADGNMPAELRYLGPPEQ